MTVAAILKVKGSHVETTRSETTLYSVAWKLKVKNIGALVVVSEDGATILGMISERDLVRGLSEHGAQLQALPVSKVMTTPVLTCTPAERGTAVMVRMTRHRVSPSAGSRWQQAGGHHQHRDVVKYRLDELELEANVLRETLFMSH